MILYIDGTLYHIEGKKKRDCIEIKEAGIDMAPKEAEKQFALLNRGDEFVEGEPNHVAGG